jgi:hypothetical protein
MKMKKQGNRVRKREIKREREREREIEGKKCCHCLSGPDF